jgi:anti-sigma-K factor RskA
MERTGIHELSAAYALDALDPNERGEFEEHLAECEECRDTVAGFRETAASLAYDAEMPAPPPALRQRILDGARRERPNVVPLRPRWAFPAAATIAAVAACAAIGLGIWAATLHNRLGERPEAVDIQGARGSLILTKSGDGTLVLDSLAAAPAGKTYEAWVIEDGMARRAGLFSGGGRIAFGLTRKVPDGAVVAVTLEDAAGVDAPTGKPLFHTSAV